MSTRSTLLGTTFLVIVLTAGAAQSLSGSNTVFTDDIVNQAVTGPKLSANAVYGSKILNDSVTGTDIDESTIPGFKRVYFAKVDASAAVAAGEAIAVTHIGAGRYYVHFPDTFSFSGCAVVGTSPLNYTPTAYVTATSGSSYIDVRVTANGTNTDRPFSIVAVCP